MQIYKAEWNKYPREVREQLAQAFGLNKSAGVEVVDGVVVSDGHTEEDLKAITREMLQSFLDSTEQDFVVLWGQALAKVGVRAHGEVAEVTKESPVKADVQEDAEEVPTPKKSKRDGKKTK